MVRDTRYLGIEECERVKPGEFCFINHVHTSLVDVVSEVTRTTHTMLMQRNETILADRENAYAARICVSRRKFFRGVNLRDHRGNIREMMSFKARKTLILQGVFALRRNSCRKTATSWPAARCVAMTWKCLT
jgi:hypothetical protein